MVNTEARDLQSDATTCWTGQSTRSMLCHSPPPICDCRWCLMSTKETETQLREIRFVKCQQRGSLCVTVLVWTKTRQHEGNECCKVIVKKQRKIYYNRFRKAGIVSFVS